MAQVREWYGVIYGTAMGRIWNCYGTWLPIGDPPVIFMELLRILVRVAFIFCYQTLLAYFFSQPE